MAFGLKVDEHPGCGLRRVYCEELCCAVKESRCGTKGSIARHVHDVRKHLKKSRAILRILREEIGKKDYKRENVRLRDTGRKLSGLRDAEVRLKTFEKLCKTADDIRPNCPEIRKILLKTKRECTKEAGPALEKVTARLRKARKHGREFKVSGFDVDAFCDSLRRIHKRAHLAFRAARKEPAHEAVHELRKRLKDLWYQLRLVCSLGPKALKEKTAQAEVLTETLGEFLDLNVLSKTLTGDRWPPGTATERETILALIATRELQLRDAGLELCATFLSETPAAFAREIRRIVKR